MKYNWINCILLMVIFLIQLLMPMADGGRTYFSYFVPFALILFRGCFIFKIFGFPVSAKIPIVGEIGTYLLTMFFFLSAFYKKGFDIYWTGILINIICVFTALILYFVEDYLFIYEYRDQEEEKNKW